jgi:hypothetical protein
MRVVDEEIWVCWAEDWVELESELLPSGRSVLLWMDDAIFIGRALVDDNVVVH